MFKLLWSEQRRRQWPKPHQPEQRTTGVSAKTKVAWQRQSSREFEERLCPSLSWLLLELQPIKDLGDCTIQRKIHFFKQTRFYYL